MTLRSHFDERIQHDRAEIVRMGNIALDMIQNAVDAIANRDSEKASLVVAADDEVDELKTSLIRETLVLVLQSNPVAADFRFLTSSLSIIGEVERVADEAVKLSKRYLKLGIPFPAELRLPLLELGKHARVAFAASLRLFTEYSSQAFDEVGAAEKQIDSEFKKARRKVFELIRNEPAATEELIRVIEVFHALEHVGDLSAEIAKALKLHYESGTAASATS